MDLLAKLTLAAIVLLVISYGTIHLAGFALVLLGIGWGLWLLAK